MNGVKYGSAVARFSKHNDLLVELARQFPARRKGGVLSYVQLRRARPDLIKLLQLGKVTGRYALSNYLRRHLERTRQSAAPGQANGQAAAAPTALALPALKYCPCCGAFIAPVAQALLLAQKMERGL